MGTHAGGVQLQDRVPPLEELDGKELHGNADALSRLVKDSGHEAKEVDVTAQAEPVLCSFVDELPLTAQEIKEETRRDLILGRVGEYVMSGWCDDVPDNLRPFFTRR